MRTVGGENRNILSFCVFTHFRKVKPEVKGEVGALKVQGVLREWVTCKADFRQVDGAKGQVKRASKVKGSYTPTAILKTKIGHNGCLHPSIPHGFMYHLRFVICC